MVAWIQLLTTLTSGRPMTMAVVFTSVVPMPLLAIMTNQPIRKMRHAGMQSLVMIAMALV